MSRSWGGGGELVLVKGCMWGRGGMRGVRGMGWEREGGDLPELRD